MPSLHQEIIDEMVDSDVKDNRYVGGWRLDYDLAATKIISLILNKLPEKPVYPDVMEYVNMVEKASKNGKYDDMYDNGFKAGVDEVRSILEGE